MPTSEKAFHLACSTLEIDIISLNLTDGRLPFMLKNNIVGEAISRGVYFEVNYAAAIQGILHSHSHCHSLDQSSRRNLFGNMVSLMRATRGRNIIISSGPTKPLFLRAAKDLMNMATLFGLSGDVPYKTLVENPRNVLYHAATRKHTHKSTFALNNASLPHKKEEFSLQTDFVSF